MKYKYLISLACIMSIAVVGCSWFTFSTNIDPQNFTEYYKASLVKQYSKEDLQSIEDYEDLGTVDGISCQVSEEEPTPSEKLAQRDLLEKSYDLGANAIIMGKCIELEATLHCIREYTCYGQALKVKEP